MESIEQLFKKNKVKAIQYSSNPTLIKEEFSDRLSWIFELLLYIPFYEQTERENFINGLPDKLINKIYEKYESQQSEILEWLTKNKETVNEKYYVTLVFQLIEERYISIHWKDNFFDDLEYFKNQSFELIKLNKKLYEVYQINKGRIEVPKEFNYFEPLVLIIREGQSFDDFYKSVPSELLDVNGKMQQFSSDYIEKRISKYKTNSIFVNNMEMLSKASSEFFSNFFSFEDF